MQLSKLVKQVEKWYELPSYEDDVQIQLRSLPPKKRREFMKLCTSRKRFGTQWEEVVDSDKLTKLMLEYVVVDWRGLLDDDNSPWPCTTENKNILDDNCTEFSALWNRFIGEQSGLDAEIKEAEEKN